MEPALWEMQNSPKLPSRLRLSSVDFGALRGAGLGRELVIKVVQKVGRRFDSKCTLGHLDALGKFLGAPQW